MGILRCHRCCRARIPIGRLLNAQALLGEALWRPPAPNGYADIEAAWIDGVPRRLDIANEFAGRLAAATDPMALLESSLGPLASADTRDTIARAESRNQALGASGDDARIPAEMTMHSPSMRRRVGTCC